MADRKIIRVNEVIQPRSESIGVICLDAHITKDIQIPVEGRGQYLDVKSSKNEGSESRV